MLDGFDSITLVRFSYLSGLICGSWKTKLDNHPFIFYANQLFLPLIINPSEFNLFYTTSSFYLISLNEIHEHSLAVNLPEKF